MTARFCPGAVSRARRSSSARIRFCTVRVLNSTTRSERERTKRVSRPSLRVYVGVDDIPAVRKGLGVNVLSTAKGILADREARRAHVGGEVICTIW